MKPPNQQTCVRPRQRLSTYDLATEVGMRSHSASAICRPMIQGIRGDRIIGYAFILDETPTHVLFPSSYAEPADLT